MNHLLILIVSFITAFSVYAQQENGINNSSNNSNTIYNNAPAEPLIIESNDTVSKMYEESEGVKEEDASKGVRKESIRTEKKAKAPAKYEAPAPAYKGDANSNKDAGLDDEIGGVADELDVSNASAIRNYSIEFKSTESEVKTQSIQRSPTYDQQIEMDAVVDYLEVNAPNSFEYNYFNYVAGNYNTELIGYLNKAEELKPNNSDVHVQKAGYHIIMDQDSKAGVYLNKLVESKRLYDVQEYCTDLLLSVPKNGVLITHGFDDTYGSEYLQILKKKRPDVEIISLDFMQSETYRENLTAEGFKLPTSDLIDVNYFKSFCSLNESKGLSISMTLPKEYLTTVQNKLYATGLVFEYHSSKFENLERNKNLWNNVLDKSLIDEATGEKEKRLSANYLPMLLILYKDARFNGTEEEIKDIEEAMDKVSVQCNKYDQVKQLKSSY